MGCVHDVVPAYSLELRIRNPCRRCPRSFMSIVYSLHQLDVGYPAAKNADNGQPGSVFMWPSLYQSAICYAWHDPVSKQFNQRLNRSTMSVANVTRRRGAFCDVGAVYKYSDLLAYLLKLRSCLQTVFFCTGIVSNPILLNVVLYFDIMTRTLFAFRRIFSLCQYNFWSPNRVIEPHCRKPIGYTGAR